MVSLSAENLLVKVGLNSHMDKVNNAVNQQWDLQNNVILMPQVQKFVDSIMRNVQQSIEKSIEADRQM